MRKTELIIFLLFLLGNIFRILEIPGSVFLIYLTLTLAGYLYLIFSFAILNGIRFRNIFDKNSYRGISTGNILGSVAAGMIFSILIQGIMFKLLFWPHSEDFLFPGIFLGSAAVIYSFVVSELPGKKKEIALRGVFLTMAGVFLFIIPSSALIRFYYRNTPELGETRLKMFEEPENRKWKDEYDLLINETSKNRRE